MRAARGVTAAALLLFVLASVPWPSVAEHSSESSSPVAGPFATVEHVSLDQFQPTSFKVDHLGSIDGPRARALRQLLDGDATEARSLAGPSLPPDISAKVNSTLSSYCSSATCLDSQVVSGDPNRFTAEAEREPLLFEFLRRAGFVTLALTLSGTAPTLEERIDLFISGAAGAVTSILPIEVGYFLNLFFGDAPSDRIAVHVFLAGLAVPRPVEFRFVSMPGYRLDSAIGLADRAELPDTPEAGYTTITGDIADPGVGTTVVLVSGGLPSYCYVVIAAVVGVCLVAMYFGWKRAKRQEKREARRRREEAKENSVAGGTDPSTDGKTLPKPGTAELAKLAKLRDSGLITEKEFAARRAEITARMKSSRTTEPAKQAK